jgi:hypothetical protein
MQVLLREPAAAWRRGPGAWRLAYAAGTVMLVVGVAHGLAWLVVGGPWEGPVTFRKPFTFGVAFGMATITLAWFADLLGVGRRGGWALLGPLVVADVSEVVWVSLQRARGVPSHFNASTPFDGLLFSLMGGAAVGVTMVVIVVITVLAFVRRLDDLALGLAVRLGLVLLLVAVADGVLMIQVGNARAAAGQTHDLVVWGTAGNMKVTHFLGIHGMQVLSGLAVWTSDTAVAARRRVALVAWTGAAWTALLVGATVQWYDGRSLAQLGLADGALLVAAVAVLGTVAAVALRLTARPTPRGT